MSIERESTIPVREGKISRRDALKKMGLATATFAASSKFGRDSSERLVTTLGKELHEDAKKEIEEMEKELGLYKRATEDYQKLLNVPEVVELEEHFKPEDVKVVRTTFKDRPIKVVVVNIVGINSLNPPNPEITVRISEQDEEGLGKLHGEGKISSSQITDGVADVGDLDIPKDQRKDVLLMPIVTTDDLVNNTEWAQEVLELNTLSPVQPLLITSGDGVWSNKLEVNVSFISSVGVSPNNPEGIRKDGVDFSLPFPDEKNLMRVDYNTEALMFSHERRFLEPNTPKAEPTRTIIPDYDSA